MEAFSAFLPLLIIIAIVIVAGWLSARSYRRHADRVEAVNEGIVRLNREMLEELREIKQVLKDQK